MFKLAVIILFIGTAAASRIATLPGVAPVISTVLPATRTIIPGVIGGIVPKYYGAVGNVIDGIDSLGLAYNNYDLNDGRVLELGVGRLGYGAGGLGGLGYGIGGLGGLDGLSSLGGLGGLGGLGSLGGLGYGVGGLGYGVGGLGYGIGGLGLGKLGGLGLNGVKLA